MNTGNFSKRGPKMRTRLGFGWCKVLAETPLTYKEMVYQEARNSKNKRKGMNVKQGVSLMFRTGESKFWKRGRVEKNMWPYSKGIRD